MDWTKRVQKEVEKVYQQIRSDANRRQYRDNAGSSKAREDDEMRRGESSRDGHKRRCFHCGKNSYLRHEFKKPPQQKLSLAWPGQAEKE